jgi:hypothetical protein
VGAATKAAKRDAALPVYGRFRDGSPFKSASPDERSAWFHRRGPRRLEDLADPDYCQSTIGRTYRAPFLGAEALTAKGQEIGREKP